MVDKEQEDWNDMVRSIHREKPLPFALGDTPFFDREVHAYDLRLAKALIKVMEKDANS